MIPLKKLETLPRRLLLRKAASIFGGAEHRLIISGMLSADEAEYLAKLTALLSGYINLREDSPTGAINALEAAGLCLSSHSISDSTPDGTRTKENKDIIRRALNNVHHILLTETGIYQADWDYTGSGGALDPMERHPFPGMQVYLEDIRSPFNVGAMFRAAESFGAEKIWLSPLCADPRHKRAERTALGCVDVLPWERLKRDPFAEPNEENHADASFLKGPFFTLETGGIPLDKFSFPPNGIMIAGTEELGVSPAALVAADASLGRVSIPMYGAKGSLNVSVAFGIVMQAWAARLSLYCHSSPRLNEQ